MEIKEPTEKDEITEDQKSKTPSPVDETKAEPQEKQPSLVIDEHITEKEDKKVPSPTKEMEQISPVAEKETQLEMQELTEKHAIAESQKTKTPSPVDETKEEPKEKQPSPLKDEHITKKEDKKIPSPIEDTKRISPIAEKITELDIQKPTEIDEITEDKKSKAPSPVDETKAEPQEKQASPVIDEHITEKEDKKIPSPTKEMEQISPVSGKTTELEIQETAEKEAISVGQKTKTPSPVDEMKEEPKEKQSSPVIDDDKKISSPISETEKISPHITEIAKVPSPTDETKRASPVAEKVAELEIQEQIKKEHIIEGQKTKAPSPVDETKEEPKEKQPPPVIDKDKKIPSPTEERKTVSPVAEKITEMEIKEPTQKDEIAEDQKSKTPSPVDETKAVPQEKQPSLVIDEHITEKEDKKIPSPTKEMEQISPLAEKVAEYEIQELAEKVAISVDQKTNIPSPVDETKAEPKEKQPSPVIDEDKKIPSPGIETEKISPVTEKILKMEIQEPTQKEAITIDQKTKTPSPGDDTKADPKEKQPSPIIDEHITEKEDKITSPTEETERISPVAEKVIELELQEPAEKKDIAEGQQTKIPSPVHETKEEPKEKESSPLIDEHIREKEGETTEETKRISPVAEKVAELEIQEQSEKEHIIEGQKTKTPSPVDETKEEPKEKQPSPVIDKDKKVPSPSEETERVSPVAEKITEIEIKEPKQKDEITEDEKSKTPSPVDETKTVPKEKEIHKVIDEHITEIEDKKFPSLTEETKRISPVAEKITKMKIEEPVQKETITEDQKTKTPSPIDETKAVPKEEELSEVLAEHITEKEDKKILSPTEETERISPASEKITKMEIEEPGEKEALSEDQKTKTLSPIDETKSVTKGKEPSPVIDDHISPKEDESTPADAAKIISSETEDKVKSKEEGEIVFKTEEEETKSPTVEEIEKTPFTAIKLDSVSLKKDDVSKGTKLTSPLKVPIELDAGQIHEDILKYLTPESRIEMSSLADEIKTEIDIDNLEEIIAEVVYNCLQIKSITVTKENFTKYIIENRVEIITIIRKKYICEYIEEQKIPREKEEIVSYEIKETESLKEEDIVIKDKLGKHALIKEDKDLDISKDETKDTKLSSPDTDSDLKVIQEVFLKEVSHRIENYDKLLKELDDECLFPSGTSADVLYNTACSEMNRKGVIISVEGIIKYIIEYKIEIVTIIKTKYSKKTSTVLDKKFTVETETSEYKLEEKVSGKEKFPVSSEFDMDPSAFIQTYDEDILSPMAESVMGEEIEIHEEQTVFESDSIIKYEKDLHVVDASKVRTETITPKTVYEKPEAEQVFRHIFAETIVDDEIEVLQDREDSSQTSLKDEEEKEVPDAMKKKLMYVEIEIEESVTSTTDASPDTDAPEIPYDGKYKEIIDDSLTTETYTKESTEKLEEKDISKIVQEASEKDIENKPIDESVSSASGLVSEELSAKELKIAKDSQEVKRSKKESKIKTELEAEETSTSKIQEIQHIEEQQTLEEKLISTKDAKEIKLQESKPEETLEKSTVTELSESSVKDSKGEEKETIPETVTTDIKKEETSFVLSTSDSPTSSEVSKLLIKTSVTEDDSSISKTVTKISSSKIVSSEIDEDTFTTVTKTEKDEDAFESTTTITTTSLIKHDDSIKEEKLTSKKSEKDAISPTEVKSPISEASPFSTEESQDIASLKIKTAEDATKIKDSVMKSAKYTEHEYKSITTEVMKDISKSDESKAPQGSEDALVEPATSEFESTTKTPSKIDELKKETFLEDKSPELIKIEDISQVKQEVQKQTTTEYSFEMQDDKELRLPEETDATPSMAKTVTTITRKIVLPLDQMEERLLHKDDKQATTPKSITPSKSPDVEDAKITEEIDESDGTSTITKTVTTVTRKIVVPSEGAQEVETSTKDDQKPSSEKSESSSKTSEVDYQKSLSPKSVSPSHTPDGDDIHVTEETEEGDGTSTITKTVTTIVRKVVVPSEDTESETTFEKDDKQASTPKSISPSKSPDVEDTQITEEIDESDGTSTITKTVTTVTRKIVVPSEGAEEVETIPKDDQKPSSEKSESSSKTSEVDYQKSLSPKSVSPSHTPDGDDIHVTEETEEGDGTATITKTVTTIVRKVVVPSEDTESETTFEKDDKQASTPKSISPSKSPDVEDTQITEEIDVSDGTSTITKTVTTVTRKIVVPSESAEESKSVSPSHTPDGDDIHVTEETEEGDATSTITKTVTTIVRKVVVPSEDTESETTFEKDDKQASTPKSISPSKSPDVEDTQITEEIDESDGTSTITKTVTTVTRKLVVPSEGAEEVETITKDDQKPSSQKSESSSKTSEVDYQKSLSPKVYHLPTHLMVTISM
ncbi:microtubule-associated protein futsch [Trichonephila clavipes]|nr:microtubule-associated protein futsch [Trichonephila clavipes]